MDFDSFYAAIKMDPTIYDSEGDALRKIPYAPEGAGAKYRLVIEPAKETFGIPRWGEVMESCSVTRNGVAVDAPIRHDDGTVLRGQTNLPMGCTPAQIFLLKGVEGARVEIVYVLLNADRRRFLKNNLWVSKKNNWELKPGGVVV